MAGMASDGEELADVRQKAPYKSPLPLWRAAPQSLELYIHVYTPISRAWVSVWLQDLSSILE